MATRVFLCPHTGQRVQGWFADDGSEDASGETYEGVSCLACNQLHMVNRRTGKVLGADEESWPQGSEQDDKWSFCLTAGTLCPANQERQ